MTALITSYKQPICLTRQINHLLTCPIIGEIRVNWFETSLPPAAGTAGRSGEVEVKYDALEDRLSERFRPRDFKYDAVFNVDVDT